MKFQKSVLFAVALTMVILVAQAEPEPEPEPATASRRQNAAVSSKPASTSTSSTSGKIRSTGPRLAIMQIGRQPHKNTRRQHKKIRTTTKKPGFISSLIKGFTSQLPNKQQTAEKTGELLAQVTKLALNKGTNYVVSKLATRNTPQAVTTEAENETTDDVVDDTLNAADEPEGEEEPAEETPAEGDPAEE